MSTKKRRSHIERITKERLKELATSWEPLEHEITREEVSRLVLDLQDARAESEHLRKALQQCHEELKRFEEIMGSIRRNVRSASVHHRCQFPGCRSYAFPGSKICRDHDDPTPADLCHVRGCRQPCSGRYSDLCADHRHDAKHTERDDGEDIMPLLSRGNRVIGKVGRFDDWDSRSYAESATYVIHLAPTADDNAPLRRVSGPPEPIPGLGLEITTHGLPAAIEPTPMGEELTRATSNIEGGEGQREGSADEPPQSTAIQAEVSLRCVYGQCERSRVSGHAFCEEHGRGL